MPNRFSHIRDHLSHHGITRKLLEQSRREQKVATALRTSLPTALEPHCLGIGVVDDKVTLFLDSAAWLTRARFLSEEIRKSLIDFQIKELTFQIRPLAKVDGSPGVTQGDPIHRLSEAVVRHLLEAASHQNDPTLRSALERLARRHATRIRTPA